MAAARSTCRAMQNPRNVPSASNSRLSPLPPEPAAFGATVDIPLDSSKDLKNREKELQAREAELNKREKELKRREEAAARAGIVIEEKNWPPFLPLIHHDITNEIPSHLQRMQYVAFASFLGLVCCLFWNVIAVTSAWVKGEGVKIWLLAIIYFISGVPGAYGVPGAAVAEPARIFAAAVALYHVGLPSLDSGDPRAHVSCHGHSRPRPHLRDRGCGECLSSSRRRRRAHYHQIKRPASTSSPKTRSMAPSPQEPWTNPRNRSRQERRKSQASFLLPLPRKLRACVSCVDW